MPFSADELAARVEALIADAKKQDDVLQSVPEQPAALPVQQQDFDPGMWAAYQDSIPEVDDNPAAVRPEAEVKIDQVIDAVDIVEAYNIWCGKMTPQVGTKRESIMISCPMPDHADKHPSAWMNLDKGTWYCGACDEGGDKFDLAAIKLGFDRKAYKDGANFGEIRRAMAKDLGLQIDYTPGVGYTVWTPADPASVTAQFAEFAEPEVQDVLPETDTPDAPASLPLPVRSAEPRKWFYEEDKNIPVLDWEAIVEPDTFLDSYMRACTTDDVAEEYHFWYAMLGLGLVNGRNVFMVDSPPVFSNMFIVLLGRTGSGKSKAKRYISAVINETAHYDPTVAGSQGVKILSTPGSAETMIDSFSSPIYDPTNLKKLITVGYHEVRGLVDFNEFKAIADRMARQGSTLSTTLMQFYDSDDQVTTQSRTYGESIAWHPHCSLISSIQPEVLNDLFDKNLEDSGFLNRFVFAGGPRKEAKMFADKMPDLTLPIHKMREIVTWGKTMHQVHVTPAAKALLESERKTTIQGDMDRLGNPFARIDLTLKKICLILAVNQMQDYIDEKIVAKALLLYPYLRDFVDIRSSQSSGSKVADFEESILSTLANKVKIIAGQVPGISARDLLRKLKRGTSAQDLNRALNELERASILEVVTVPPSTAGGRPTKKYWFKETETYIAYLSA